jgi:hypothetical protein
VVKKEEKCKYQQLKINKLCGRAGAGQAKPRKGKKNIRVKLFFLRISESVSPTTTTKKHALNTFEHGAEPRPPASASTRRWAAAR